MLSGGTGVDEGRGLAVGGTVVSVPVGCPTVSGRAVSLASVVGGVAEGGRGVSVAAGLAVADGAAWLTGMAEAVVLAMAGPSRVLGAQAEEVIGAGWPVQATSSRAAASQALGWGERFIPKV